MRGDSGKSVGDQEKIWEYFQSDGVDTFSRNRGRQEFLVRQLLRGSIILNIGVGNGALESLALKKGIKVHTLDPSERAILRVREELNLLDSARVGYSDAIPFPDATFDVVVMSEVLEHLDEEKLRKSLDEVRRVLKAGGRFIGTVPARENLLESTLVCPKCGIRFHRWGHQRSFDVGQMRQILESQFADVRVAERFFIDWETVGLWQKFKGLIKKLLSWQGVGTYGICRNIYFSAVKNSVSSKH